MKDIIDFLNIHYKNAIKLVNDFDITKNKKWDEQIYLNELYVQVGHVYNVLYKDNSINESKRSINNLGDELSDVVLQLMNLANYLNIDMYEITSIKDFEYGNINGLSVLLGQLTEVIMESNDCRFKKDRDGFKNSYDFVKDRLFKMFIITFKIAKEYKLNMIMEFQLMLDDANAFLKRFKKNKNNNQEYIDIYDNKENHVGFCNKEIAHKLGLWHKVFGCVIINGKKNKIYFQLKNPNYNKIHNRELLEITAGGHLQSGESLQNGVREIEEETGLNISYQDLTFIKKRKINKKVSKDFILKEFQYYYFIDLNNIVLSDFCNFDKKEVSSFVEVNIKDVIKILNGSKEKIKANKLVNGNVVKTTITIKDFDPDYLKENLYNELIQNIIQLNKDNTMKKKINYLYKITKIDKIINPNKYYFDNGSVCNRKEYLKNEFRFTIMKVRKSQNNDYVIYLKINYKNKSIPLQLSEEFKNNRGTNRYLNYLCDYVDSNNANEIINKCYVETKKVF